MVGIGSTLQVFTVLSIVFVVVVFIVRVSIQALILRLFTKKYNLSQKYKKAWMAIFIPALIISLLAVPISLAGLPDFLLIILYLLFFPILIFSVKFMYKIDSKTSALISLKFFLLVAIIIVIFSGVQTIVGGTDSSSLESNVPQSVCTADCEFAYSLKGGSSKSLIVVGYNIPIGDYPNKENYIIIEKTFSENELNLMDTGKKDVNGRMRIQGKLESNNCNYMEFSRGETTGSQGGQCEESSKNFLTNLKNSLI